MRDANAEAVYLRKTYGEETVQIIRENEKPPPGASPTGQKLNYHEKLLSSIIAGNGAEIKEKISGNLRIA